MKTLTKNEDGTVEVRETIQTEVVDTISIEKIDEEVLEHNSKITEDEDDIAKIEARKQGRLDKITELETLKADIITKYPELAPK